MKKALLSLAALATVAAAAPAMAQPYDGGGYGRGGYDNAYRGRGDNDYGNFEQRINRLERRIETGIRNGDLDRREARSLRYELRQLMTLESRYDNDGYNRWERQQLEVRLDRLEQRVHFQRSDNDYRGDGRWDGRR